MVECAQSYSLARDKCPGHSSLFVSLGNSHLYESVSNTSGCNIRAPGVLPLPCVGAEQVPNSGRICLFVIGSNLWVRMAPWLALCAFPISVRLASIKILYLISFKFDCEKQKTQKHGAFLSKLNVHPSAALDVYVVQDLDSCLTLQ